MPQIPFVGPSYRTRSSSLDDQACINLFPVTTGSGTAKAVTALYGTPGSRPLAVGGSGVVRGMHAPTDGGPGIIVIGNSVYRLNAAFALSLVGSLSDAVNTAVKIDDNGVDAVIVTGLKGYTLNLATSVVTEIVDPAFYGADNVDFLNTYAIFNRPGTNQFFISGANEITFDPLDFASAESHYEPIVNFIVNHDEIMFFKSTVTEIWRITANPDFPFVRDTNAAIEQGCAARDSIAALDNSVFWLGNNTDGAGIVWRMNGYTPVRVSTDAIEYAIAGYATISDAVAYSYQQEGHSFYVINFPSGNTTWVFDAATNLWHQRAYLNPASGALGRHRSNCHMFYNGKHVVGDYLNGNISTLDLDYYKDGTDPMPSIRTAPYVGKGFAWVNHRTLQIDFESGVGLTTGQGSDPQVYLDWSDDNGKRWSNQRAAKLGKLGQYRTRVQWHRLGRSRARIYRVTISDPVKRVIIAAAINP